MRLVEGVVGEREQGVPEGLDGADAEPSFGHPGRERLELLVQLLLLLLAHRPAQQVGLAQGVARQLLRNLHDLFLIDDQAVGLTEDHGKGLPQFGVDRLHGLPTGLAAGVLVVGVSAHRSGPVESTYGRDVLEAVRLHRPQQRPHRSAVELEDAERVTTLHQGVRRGIVEWQILQHHGATCVAVDVDQRVVKDGEVAQTQEVHLDQTQLLAGRIVELGDDRAILRALHQRDDL